jgi:ATP-dependent Clp protease adapter protein ClpS
MSEPKQSEPPFEPYDTSPKSATKTRNKPQTRQLPPYKVILHNDEVNEIGYVVRSIMEITHMNKVDAQRRTLEAHHTGLSLLLVTHKERAELYVDQLTSKGLTVSTEPV